MIHKSIIINWQGPYPVDKNKRGKGEFEDIFFKNGGLYLFTGKHDDLEKEEKITYIGIVEDTKNNNYWERFKRHKTLPKVKNLNVWLGNIVHPSSKAREYLEETEKMLIYFADPKLNTQKKTTPPQPMTVINKWYKPDYNDWSNEPRLKKPYVLSELDDVLVWDGNLCWAAEKLLIYELATS